MAIFSSSQPGIRARILPRFPANVLAGTGIAITKSGGTYIFSTALSAVPLSALESIAVGTLVGRATGSGAGPPQVISVSGGLGFTGAAGLEMTLNQRSRALAAVFPAVAAGQQQDFVIPIACTITKVTLLANAVGSTVVNILKSDFATFPTLTSICASALPTLAGVQKVQDSTLTGWTVSIAAGDVLRFNINSASTITRLSVCLDAVAV